MIDFQTPLLLALLIPIAGFVCWRRLSLRRDGLRLLGICLLLVLAAGPSFESSAGGDRLALVIDRSQSMPSSSVVREISLLAKSSRRSGDRLAVVSFADGPIVERSFDSETHVEAAALNPQQSNLFAAVDKTLSLFGAGESGRILVLSDGLSSDAPSAALLERARDQRITVHVLPIERPRGEDVVLASVAGLIKTSIDSALRYEVSWTCPNPMQVNLYARVGRNRVKEQSVLCQAGLNAATVPIRFEESGMHRLEFEVRAVADPVPENNQFTMNVQVRGDPSFLRIHTDAGTDLAASWLQNRSFKVESRNLSDRRLTLEELSRHHACLLDNVPVTALDSDEQDVLWHYVARMGGGLSVAGGNASYALGGYQLSAIDGLLPVDLASAQVTHEPIEFVLVADLSSVDHSSEAFKNALLSLVSQMAPTDALALYVRLADGPVSIALKYGPTAALIESEFETLNNFRGGFFGAAKSASNLRSDIQSATEEFSEPRKAHRHFLVCAPADQLGYNPWSGDSDPFQGVADVTDSVTVIAVGTRSMLGDGSAESGFAFSSLQSRPGTELKTVEDVSRLPSLILQEFAQLTGTGLVQRSVLAKRVEGDVLGRISEFNPAVGRPGAVVDLVDQPTSRVALAAHHEQGGRIQALLFPLTQIIGQEPLERFVEEQLQWVLENPIAQDYSAALEYHDGTYRVTIPTLPHEPDKLTWDISNPRIDYNVRIAPSEQGGKLQGSWRSVRTGQYYVTLVRDDQPIRRLPPIVDSRSREFSEPLDLEKGRHTLLQLAQRTGGSIWDRENTLFRKGRFTQKSLLGFIGWLFLGCFLWETFDLRRTLGTPVLRRNRTAKVPANAAPNPAPVQGPNEELLSLAKKATRRRIERT